MFVIWNFEMLCHLYTAIKYTTEKKYNNDKDSTRSPIWKDTCFVSEDKWEKVKNIRLNFEIGFTVDRKSSILTGKAHGEI